MEIEDKWKKPIKAPLGIYVWSILVILRFGIANFISYVITIRDAEGELYLPVIIVSLSLCLFSALAALFAIFGENAGRIALIILGPLNIIWVLLLVLPALLGDDVAEGKAAVLVVIQQAFLSLWVIGMVWYFMTTKVVEYYKQNG